MNNRDNNFMSVSIFVFSLPINYNFVLTLSVSPTILLSKDSSICDNIVLDFCNIELR